MDIGISAPRENKVDEAKEVEEVKDELATALSCENILLKAKPTVDSSGRNRPRNHPPTNFPQSLILYFLYLLNFLYFPASKWCVAAA
jgi:hypothetical protein